MVSHSPLARLRLLQGPEIRHVSGVACRQIETALLAQGVPGVDNGGAVATNFGRALNRSGLLRNIGFFTETAYFAAFMQPGGHRLFPQGIWAETIPFCYDCWPPDYPRWISLFRRMRIRLAFLTARQSADYLSSRIEGLETVWLPEAIAPDRFDPSRPLAERGIDVLELGRRWDRYHDAIAEHCRQRSYRHLFELRKTEIVFATEEQFVAGMGDARISVCFPSSITHPERSGTVETLTQRYLESMAAGALLVGHCPAELAELFGYDPVIAVDWTDPAAQLDSILGNIDSYEDMRRRNLTRLREVGTWDRRVDSLLYELSRRGY